MIITGPDYANIVTWCVVFLGWYAVHQATLVRDRRKEKREISAKLCTSLIELQSAAIDFHTASQCDVRQSTDLAQQVERAVLQLQKLPLNELSIPLSRMIALRQRITRQNIDLTDFASQPADSQIIFEIRNAVTDMIFAIEDARERVWK